MKAGLPVFAASALRQLRRAASRDFCSGVYAVVCSRSDFREALEGFGLAPLLDFFRREELAVLAEESLRSRSGGRGPVRVRPSWGREALLKVMRLPLGLVH